MTSKWKKGRRLQSAQEIEESMSQELADLGMLEHGMTFQDKKDLLSAVKLSQKSAKAEEEERKTKPSPQRLNSDNTEDDSNASIKNDHKSKEVSEDISQDILCNLSLALADCDSADLSQTNSNQYSVQPLDYFGTLNSVTHNLENNLKMKRSQVNSPNSSITVSSKDSEVGSTSGENGNIQNGCENEEAKATVISDNENELEAFSSIGPNKHSETSTFRRRKDDRERNIDVFSQCSDNEKQFSRSSKTSSRVPFYFVPEGMNIHRYIAYFKCCVSQYYKNLSYIQKSSIEHIEWGAPITMDTSSVFASLRSSAGDGDCSSRRYNFRDRYPKPKLRDLPSENSDDAEEEEEESNEEDMFVPRHKKSPGIKLSAKRKNTSSSDVLSTKKEKKECSAAQRIIQDDGESIREEGCVDVSAVDPTGEALERSFQKSRGGTPSSRKRARKSRAKLKQLQADIQEEITEILPDPDNGLASIIEPDIVIAECPQSDTPPPMLDDINQSSSLNSKQRRLQHQAENIRQNRRKSEPRKNLEVVLIGEEIKTQPEEALEKVRCPICSCYFPSSYIEEHASECNQYSPENPTITKS